MRGRIIVILFRMWRISRWVLLTLALLYAAIVVYAFPHDHQAHLDATIVAKIQAQKLTDADVDGSHLPPAPDPDQMDATIAGVDANDNGIRDDVELAIFQKYPTSSATSTDVRSAELQYAMDLQIQVTQVVDTATWMAAIQQTDRSYECLDSVSSDSDTLEKEVEGLVLNTKERNDTYNFVWQYRTSHALLQDPSCDVVRAGDYE